jgi:hypothetical protein
MTQATIAGGLLLVVLLAAGCDGLAGGAPAETAPTTTPEPAEPVAADKPAAQSTESTPATDPAADPADAGPMPWETPSGGGKPAEMVLVEDPRYNEEEPVLFDSGYEEDNASCMVCHIDFEREEISAIHLEAGVTCAACHGDSEVHRSDEFNIIRPDVIWGRAEIEPFCRQCHPKHKDPQKVDAFLAEWEGKRRENGRWVLRGSVCTDCHGQHAIVTGEGAFK